MAFGNRCPLCKRSLSQRGSGFTSSMKEIAKRAMAREIGRRMAAATTRIQRYGAGQKGRGGLTNAAMNVLKTVATSAPVRAAGSAAIGALTKRSLRAINPPRKTKKTSTGKKRRRRPPSQLGGILPILPALVAAAPLIAKTVGLGALSGAAGFGMKKALGG